MRYLLLALALAGGLAAQHKDKPPAPESTELREVRHQFDFAATRAAAYIHSADSIEANLAADGAVLHPRIAVLRLRIVAALNEARAAINERDFAAARSAIDRAEALIDRFAHEIGG
jgi:hypothetical protein